MPSLHSLTGRACLPALSLYLLLAGLWGPVAVADAVPTEPAGGETRYWLDVRMADQRRIVSLPLVAGQTWCLVWNHSVEGFPVHDCYRNRNGRMVLERSHQPDFAAGLGHVLGRGQPVSDGAGGYWIEDIDEPVPGNRYLLRVGSPEVNHRLVSGDTRVSLSELATGERVLISLRVDHGSSQ
ncbi:DUF1850 domain-containing protein [Litchfieldella rifensis]|uniref:DUF1850 domain-containing protein n=1 Tax=Litchfieldella rifensis TaxID=762643 RepID=A0ABV7LUQ6_9GAMM